MRILKCIGFIHYQYAFSIVAVIILLSTAPAFSAENNCLACHMRYSKGKSVHAAVQMGCSICHVAIDANSVPHKKTNNIAKGLSAEQPELCYGCHDKSKFEKKNVHVAIGMGCTSCHNPHSSKMNERLLISAMPDICYGCHDKSEFNKKNVHKPVAGGMCLGCHNPHSSDEFALLNKPLNRVCYDCHDDVRKKPHAITGFFGGGHSLGDKKVVNDPARPGKTFYCGSCHNPHSSDSIRLFRYPAQSAMEICTKCHKY